MPSKSNRNSEHDIAVAAMKYLKRLGSKTATTTMIKKHVPNFIKLTDDDREPSGTRPNEELWHQVVGNIVSHRALSPENFVNRGLLSYEPRKLSLTDSGEAYLKKLGL